MGTFEGVVAVMVAAKSQLLQQLFTGGFLIKSRPFWPDLAKMVVKNILLRKRDESGNFIRQRLFLLW